MFSSQYFSFPLSVSFHHCSILIYIYMMFLPEWQITGTFRKQCSFCSFCSFGNREALDRKMCSGFQLSKVCATAQSVGQSPSTLLGNTSPNPRPVYVEFVVDNLTLGQTLSQYLGYPLSLSPHKRSHHHPTNDPIITLTCKPILLLLEIPTDATFRRLKKLWYLEGTLDGMVLDFVLAAFWELYKETTTTACSTAVPTLFGRWQIAAEGLNWVTCKTTVSFAGCRRSSEGDLDLLYCLLEDVLLVNVTSSCNMFLFG